MIQYIFKILTFLNARENYTMPGAQIWHTKMTYRGQKSQILKIFLDFWWFFYLNFANHLPMTTFLRKSAHDGEKGPKTLPSPWNDL